MIIADGVIPPPQTKKGGVGHTYVYNNIKRCLVIITDNNNTKKKQNHLINIPDERLYPSEKMQRSSRALHVSEYLSSTAPFYFCKKKKQKNKPQQAVVGWSHVCILITHQQRTTTKIKKFNIFVCNNKCV